LSIVQLGVAQERYIIVLSVFVTLFGAKCNRSCASLSQEPSEPVSQAYCPVCNPRLRHYDSLTVHLSHALNSSSTVFKTCG